MDRWFVHPSLRTVVTAVLSWLLGLLVLVQTGILFRSGGLLLPLVMAALLGIVIRLVMNYIDKEKKY